MNNNYLFLLSLILLVSAACGGNQKDEVIDMKDITPQAKHKVSVLKAEEKALDYGFNRSVADSVGLKVMEIDSVEEPFFVDRFSPRSQTKLELQLKEGQLLYCQWTFKDSLK